MADDVSVRFGAQTDGLNDGIKDSEDHLKSLKESVDEVSESLKGLAEVAGVAFGVDQIKEAIDSYAELGEQISRTARITGESSDQIQLFNTAIKLSGGDAGDAALTLGILQKNIGDAISKAGPARAAFADMGISLEQLKNTDVVNLLFQMKENLDEAGTSAQASALKMEDMRAVAGRSGAQFLALKGGIEEIKEILDQTGASMSPKMVENADKLAEHTKVLGLAFTGLAHTLIDEAAPALTSLTDRMASALEGYAAFVNYAKQNGLGSALLTATVGGIADHYSGQSDQTTGPSGVSGQWNPAPTRTLHGVDSAGGADQAPDNSLALSDIKTQEEIAKLKLQMSKDEMDQEVALGKESKVQELGDLQDLLGEEYDAELAALEQKKALYAEGSDQYNEVLNEEDVLLQKYLADYQKVNEQIAQASAEQIKKTQEEYKSFFDTVDKSLDQMLAGVLQGTQTWTEAVDRAFARLAESFIEYVAKMAVKWVAFEALQKAQSAFGVGGGIATALGKEIPSFLGGSAGQAGQDVALTANTTALGTISAQLLALETALGVNTTTQSTTIASNTLNTGLNTTATASNTLALGASSATGAGGGLLSSVGKFLGFLDVGSWSIPSDGMAFLHAGEMVVPPTQAAAIRSGSAGIGGVGSSGTGGQFTININAIDTQTGTSFLKQNAAVIAQTLAGSTRNFSSSLSGAWKS